MYNNKKSAEAIEEEGGSAHLVKGGIEMLSVEDNLNNRRLNKGKSLPKPNFNRQYGMQNIIKALSLTPYELQSSWPLHESDIEEGNPDLP